MKGDIAFAGFMLTAEEWQALDADSRAQLIAVATRRVEPVRDPVVDPPRRFPEGTGKHEIIEIDSDCLIELEDDDEPVELQRADEREPEHVERQGERPHEPVELQHDDERDSNLEPVSSTAPGVDETWEDFADLNEI